MSRWGRRVAVTNRQMEACQSEILHFFSLHLVQCAIITNLVSQYAGPDRV